MNNNIQEPYCSYELSKLFKEKEFDVRCDMLYDEGDPNIKVGHNKNSFNKRIAAPTHALAIEWIRVNFNYFIYPTPYGDKKWCFIIHDLKTHSTKTEGLFSTPQEATEAALLYTLQNLIP